MATPNFLSLCQEIRDSIYTYALDAGTQSNRPLVVNDHVKQYQPCAPWTIVYGEDPPIATYLSLMLCCRQLHAEVKAFLTQASRHGSTAKLIVEACYPEMRAWWMCIPRPPEQITDLIIDIRLRNYFDPIFNTGTQHNVLLRPVFDIVQAYIKRGPRMTRASQLPRALELRTVQVIVKSDIPLEDLTYVFGNPAIQLSLVTGHLKALAMRLARSGLLFGAVGTLGIGLEDSNAEPFHVTSNLWDEGDFVFFRDLGYRWDPPAKLFAE